MPEVKKDLPNILAEYGKHSFFRSFFRSNESDTLYHTLLGLMHHHATTYASKHPTSPSAHDLPNVVADTSLDEHTAFLSNLLIKQYLDSIPEEKRKKKRFCLLLQELLDSVSELHHELGVLKKQNEYLNKVLGNLQQATQAEVKLEKESTFESRLNDDAMKILAEYDKQKKWTSSASANAILRMCDAIHVKKDPALLSAIVTSYLQSDPKNRQRRLGKMLIQVEQRAKKLLDERKVLRAENDSLTEEIKEISKDRLNQEKIQNAFNERCKVLVERMKELFANLVADPIGLCIQAGRIYNEIVKIAKSYGFKDVEGYTPVLEKLWKENRVQLTEEQLTTLKSIFAHLNENSDTPLGCQDKERLNLATKCQQILVSLATTTALVVDQPGRKEGNAVDDQFVYESMTNAKFSDAIPRIELFKDKFLKLHADAVAVAEQAYSEQTKQAPEAYVNYVVSGRHHM